MSQKFNTGLEIQVVVFKKRSFMLTFHNKEQLRRNFGIFLIKTKDSEVGDGWGCLKMTQKEAIKLHQIIQIKATIIFKDYGEIIAWGTGKPCVKIKKQVSELLELKPEEGSYGE